MITASTDSIKENTISVICNESLADMLMTSLNREKIKQIIADETAKRLGKLKVRFLFVFQVFLPFLIIMRDMLWKKARLLVTKKSKLCIVCRRFELPVNNQPPLYDPLLYVFFSYPSTFDNLFDSMILPK